MSTHKLENQLKEQQYTFYANFATEVLEGIRREITPIFLRPRWLFLGLAASVVLCMVSVYMQDGNLSIDAILGLSEYNEMTNYYRYVQL
jgi:hypothetical protein|tara:strand:+ start:218 stop:484 length:267 start_codon:yes stop_codon:yes gene_type:complete